jgi:hypothetical protein
MTAEDLPRFGIETADQRQTVGAITEIIIVAAGYYERAEAVLSAIERRA